MTANIAASVRARLMNIAKAEGSDFNQILVRYTLERLLYRLSISDYAEHFLLKCELLFTLWYDMPHRATRDIDLLGFGTSDLVSIAQTFRKIASITIADGIMFDPESVQVEEIRKDAGYFGARVTMKGELARAQCKAQIDIGFGDAVTPAPVVASFPVLLADFAAPQLRTYPVYTVVAEKLHAMFLLGMTNSRLKDYWDIWIIFEREALDSTTLAEAIVATFIRRGMVIPKDFPVGLTEEFYTDITRQKLWKAFLRKNELENIALEVLVSELRKKLGQVFINLNMFEYIESN